MGQPKDLESNPSPTYNVSSTHDSSNHDHISTNESDFVDAPFEVDEHDPTSSDDTITKHKGFLANS